MLVPEPQPALLLEAGHVLPRWDSRNLELCDPAQTASSLPELKPKLIKHDVSGLKSLPRSYGMGQAADPAANSSWIACSSLFSVRFAFSTSAPDLCCTDVSAGARKGRG